MEELSEWAFGVCVQWARVYELVVEGVVEGAVGEFGGLCVGGAVGGRGVDSSVKDDGL